MLLVAKRTCRITPTVDPITRVVRARSTESFGTLIFPSPCASERASTHHHQPTITTSSMLPKIARATKLPDQNASTYAAVARALSMMLRATVDELPPNIHTA